MSILAADLTTHTLAFYLCWLGAAVWVALMTGILRPRKSYVDRHTDISEDGILSPTRRADWIHVRLLLLGAMGSFAAWVLTQVIYGIVRHPGVDGAGQPRWAPVDLVLLQLIAGVIGWGTGYLLLKRRHATWLVGYQFRRFFNGVLTGTLGIFIAMPMVYFVLEGTLWLWTTVHIDHPAKHQLLIAMDETPSRWVRDGAIFAAVVMAPLFEELLFRGFIQTAMRRATRSPLLSILVSSALFSVIHEPWTIPPIFVFAVLLGLVYERTHNLWATTIMHALFNASAILTSAIHIGR